MIDQAIYTLSIIIAAALLAYVILWSGLQTFNANPSKRFMRIWPKLALYYAAYTMPIWVLLLLVGWISNAIPIVAQRSVLTIILAIAAMGLYFYTVFVQPNRLRLHYETVDLGLKAPLTVAVLADLRVGLYSGKPRHIRKLVATINELSVDAVLITGDWLYYPGADLVGQLMLFKGVNKPIYTVMSISDLRYQSMNTTKQGQPLLEDTLACAFDVLDITYIGQQCWPLPPKRAHIAQTHGVNTRPYTELYTEKLRTEKTGKISTELNDKLNTELNMSPVQRPKTKQQMAMLCGWQDIPKQYLKEVSLPVSEKQILKASQVVKRAKSFHEAHTDVIIATNKAALSTEIEKATLPVIILASRFDSVADLPKALQPRPLLITGAAKSAKSNESLNKLSQPQQYSNKNATIKSTIMALTGIDNKRGLYQQGSAQVFVSSGIGTRGLPFRLRRPTIDVLTIR